MENKETALIINEMIEKWDDISIKVRNIDPSITKEELYKAVLTIFNNSLKGA